MRLMLIKDYGKGLCHHGLKTLVARCDQTRTCHSSLCDWISRVYKRRSDRYRDIGLSCRWRCAFLSCIHNNHVRISASALSEFEWIATFGDTLVSKVFGARQGRKMQVSLFIKLINSASRTNEQISGKHGSSAQARRWKFVVAPSLFLGMDTSRVFIKCLQGVHLWSSVFHQTPPHLMLFGFF